MNYYKRHIGDYMKDASHLSLLEHGVYMRLLDVYYTRETRIPVEQAARLIGARTRDEREALSAITAEFFTVEDGHYVQARCDREIAVMLSKAETNRVVGKRGGRPKKETQTVSGNAENRNPEKTQTVSEINPNETQANSHKPITNNQEYLSSQVIGTPRAVRGDDDKPQNPAEWIEVFAEQHGVDVDHRSFHDRKKFYPLAAAWTAAGVTVGQMRAACAKAHAEATESIAWLPAYADRVLASMQAQRTAAVTSAESFAERDARLHRERWEEMTGRQWPGSQATNAADCIDVEPTFPRIEP